MELLFGVFVCLRALFGISGIWPEVTQASYRHFLSYFQAVTNALNRLRAREVPRGRSGIRRCCSVEVLRTGFRAAICRGGASWKQRCIPVPCCPRPPPATASCPSECGIGLSAQLATI